MKLSSHKSLLILNAILLLAVSSCTTVMLGAPVGNDWTPAPVADAASTEGYLTAALSRGSITTAGTIEDWHAQAGLTVVKDQSMGPMSELQVSFAARGFWNWVSFKRTYEAWDGSTTTQLPQDIDSTAYGGTAQAGVALLLGEPGGVRFLMAFDAVYSLECGPWIDRRKALENTEGADIINLSDSGNSLDLYPGFGVVIDDRGEKITIIAGVGYCYPDFGRGDPDDMLLLCSRLSVMSQQERMFEWICMENLLGWGGKIVLKGGIGVKL